MSKKVGVVVLLALFALSFVGSFVSAESLLDRLLSGNTASFTSSFSSFVNSNAFVQFLLFVLVAVIVYSIAGMLPFIGEKGWVAGIIAIVIAILATFYLKPVEVQSILLSYGALGIVLTVIVPFFAIAAISKRSHEKGYAFLGKMLWVLFLIILTLRLLTVDQAVIGDFGYLMYVLFAAAALVMVFLDNWIFMKIFKQVVSGHIDAANRLNVARLVAKRNTLQEELSGLESGTPEWESVKGRIKDLDRQIRSASG